MAENEKHWYVIHTYSGHEERVKKNLEQRIKFMDSNSEIARIEIPMEQEIEVRSGKRRTVTRKILPGYVLVNMKMDENTWSVVRNTPGVTGFVGSGNTPTPDASWSAWQSVSNGSAVASPAGRYLQYEVIFTTSNQNVTATLQDITFQWF